MPSIRYGIHSFSMVFGLSWVFMAWGEENICNLYPSTYQAKRQPPNLGALRSCRQMGHHSELPVEPRALLDLGIRDIVKIGKAASIIHLSTVTTEKDGSSHPLSSTRLLWCYSVGCSPLIAVVDFA